jgi:hypothetical protein
VTLRTLLVCESCETDPVHCVELNSACMCHCCACKRVSVQRRTAAGKSRHVLLPRLFTLRLALSFPSGGPLALFQCVSAGEEGDSKQLTSGRRDAVQYDLLGV